MAEAARMGIKIAPPDINLCDRDFTVDGDNVRFGLAAVKGVGDRAIQAICAGRKEVGRFKNLYDFAKNVDLHAVNRAAVEALIKCGAFDALSATRPAMIAAIDHAIELGLSALQDKLSGQMSFFDGLSGAAEPPPRFPNVEPWSEAQLLAAEKETLGFYISSHPLVHYGRELRSLSWPEGKGLANLEELPDSARITIGCMIAQVRPTVTKTGKSAGKKMAMLTLEDLTGKADAVAFSETYERLSSLIHPEAMVFVVGMVDRRRDRPSIIVDDIIPINLALEQLTGAILLRPPAGSGSEFFKGLQDVLAKHRGQCPIVLEIVPSLRSDVKAVVKPDRQWCVQPSRNLIDALTQLLPEENILLRPKPGGNGTPRRGQFNKFGSAPRGQTGQASPAVTRFD
jgi:DNA polymerase-3 subunit alpha